MRRGFRLDENDGTGLPVQFTPFATDEALAAGDDPSPAAEDYARRLKAELPSERKFPCFDLVLIGIGPDGHILSVFPEHDLVPEDLPLVYTTPAPQAVSPHVPRLTINPRLLPIARRVILLAVGESKAEPLARALRPNGGGPTAWGAGKNAIWMLDQAAAARLAG